MSGLGDAPISVFPKESGHGDVHQFIVMRSNGDSLTVDEFRRVFEAVTGHPMDENQVNRDWFAEEDR